MEILGEHVEASHRKVVIVKVREGYHAYRQMLHYYAVKNLLAYLQSEPRATLRSMHEALAGPRQRQWDNLGGQLIPLPEVIKLISGIKAGKPGSWPEIHRAYDELWAAYPLEKQRHAYGTLLALLGVESLTPALWRAALDEAMQIQEYIRDQVFLTRQKDYENPFRRATYRNAEEMRAVVGTAEDNSFVKLVRGETETFRNAVSAAKQRE